MSATPSKKLPPTERDFEIYENVHVRGLSTYSQADLHKISQTRVRQIIRRVVEWLGEVIPPQTQVAKEQETHLARQIAADRFQHQLEEVTSLWDETRESKYAGIRIRLTTAQARLGVVGGLIDGLAADAIEGIPVPAWTQTEIREGEAPAEPVSSRHTPCAVEPDAPDQKPRKSRRAPNAPLPWYCFDPIALDELTPEIIAGRAAHGFPLPESFVRQYYESQRNPSVPANVVPSRREGPETEPAFHPNAPSPTTDIHLLPSSTPQSELRTPHFPPPPSGDCSTSSEGPTHAPTVSPDPSIENPVAPTPCDETLTDQIDRAPASSSPSQPLLTNHHPLPVTEVRLTPNQPGATLSPTTSPDSLLPIPDSLASRPLSTSPT